MALHADFAKWFPVAARSVRPSSPSLRLIAFPNAGSAESIFTGVAVAGGKRAPNALSRWAAASNVEVLAVQPPGREARRSEPVPRSAAALAAALLPVLLPEISGGVPYAVVAHSVGTWVAYELLQALRAVGAPLPVQYCVSCFPAPDIAPAARPWVPNAGLAEAAFQKECRGWDVNEVVFSRAMWGVYEPLMRADFRLFDEYEFAHAAQLALPVPILAFFAERDKKVTEQHVRTWQRCSTAPAALFEVVRIAGHHLFVYDEAARTAYFERVCATLEERMIQPLAPPPSAGPAAAAASQGCVLRMAFNTAKWDPSDAEFEAALALIPPADQVRVKKFVFPKDRKLAWGSRMLQRLLVHRVLGTAYDAIEIGRTREGKPYLAGAGAAEATRRFLNFNFNVSHHGSIVAIASEPVCLVGVDIVDCGERPCGERTAETFFLSFESNFTASEWATIKRDAPDDHAMYEQFYRHWALKESYIKAVGIGLGFDLQKAEFTYRDASERRCADAAVSVHGQPRPDWAFRFSQLENGHVACVSRGPAADAIEGYRMTLSAAQRPVPPAEQSAGLALSQPAFDMLSWEELVDGRLEPAAAPAKAAPAPAAAPADGVDKAAAALVESLKLEDDLLDWPAEAAGWALDDIQAFYDSCGVITP